MGQPTAGADPADPIKIVGQGERLESFLQKRGLEPGRFMMRAFDASQPKQRNIVRFHLEPALFAEERDALWSIWQDAACTLTAAYERTNHARHLLESATRFLAAELGTDLPEPQYATINPAQAICDALSDEAKAAVDAVPDKLFEDDGGIDHSALFLRSIEIADEVGPQIWSLFRSGGFVAFNVQRYNLITLHKRIRLVIDTVEADPSVFGEEGFGKYVSYSGYPEDAGIVQIQIESATPSEVRNEFIRVHEVTVRRLASAKWKRNG